MENDQFKLPENAQRELKPSEGYELILSKNNKYQGVTVWSVCIGLMMYIAIVVFMVLVSKQAKVEDE